MKKLTENQFLIICLILCLLISMVVNYGGKKCCEELTELKQEIK